MHDIIGVGRFEARRNLDPGVVDEDVDRDELGFGVFDQAASDTFTPCSANARAMCTPMPRDAPVTTAVRPRRSFIVAPLSTSARPLRTVAAIGGAAVGRDGIQLQVRAA